MNMTEGSPMPTFNGIKHRIDIPHNVLMPTSPIENFVENIPMVPANKKIEVFTDKPVHHVSEDKIDLGEFDLQAKNLSFEALATVEKEAFSLHFVYNGTKIRKGQFIDPEGLPMYDINTKKWDEKG